MTASLGGNTNEEGAMERVTVIPAPEGALRYGRSKVCAMLGGSETVGRRVVALMRHLCSVPKLAPHFDMQSV